MQPIGWYIRRLKTMSPEEIGWRAKSGARDLLDRYRVALGRYPSLEDALGGDGARGFAPGFRATDIDVGEWKDAAAGTDEGKWRDRLIRQADLIVQHKLSFFDLKDKHLGDPIDWNRDHSAGRKAPLDYAQSIDYRDFKVTGDCKLVWEPNRCHHLVVLGRAYRVSGDKRYAEDVVKQIESWLDQCPYGRGMNWRSPMELSIRLINWVWAVDLIAESGVVAGKFRARLIHSVYLSLWDVTRKYSRGSSANNHTIGEAAGVYIATSYFNNLKNAAMWREEARDILIRELMLQSYPDGCTREHALGYQFFVLQFFIFAGIVGRWAGDDFPPEYWARIEKMLEFIGLLVEGGGEPPMFGDCDDGYVLDLGGSHRDPRYLLSIGAILFGRPDFKAWPGGYSEPVRWLLGRDGREKYNSIEEPGRAKLQSRRFSDSGYILLQCGEREADDRISVFFDCARLGFGSIAAHGHADALSFTLRAFGVDVFIDPGTYDYFTYPDWRKYFRSTLAHNTVAVDGADQSEMLGPFMWGKRAEVKIVRWEPRDEGGGRVCAEHDGYARLADPVTHRRTLKLDGASRALEIRDEIIAGGRHDAAICFHLSETCRLAGKGANTFEIDTGKGFITFEIDQRLTVETLNGSENPIGGWISRGYHQKTPSTTIVARGVCDGGGSFISKVTLPE